MGFDGIEKIKNSPVEFNVAMLQITILLRMVNHQSLTVGALPCIVRSYVQQPEGFQMFHLGIVEKVAPNKGQESQNPVNP